MARDTKKIDAKGRFFIPTKFKEAIGDKLVVTNGLDDGYLCVYTMATFDHIKEQLRGMNSVKPDVRKMRRTIVGEALEVSIDSQGRISVSSELWERIGAKPGDEICVFNIDDKLDICTKAHYDSENHSLSSILNSDDSYFVEGL